MPATKSAFTVVLEEANAPAWVSGYAIYLLNTTPGQRPSGAARQAVSDWKNGMTEEDNAARIKRETDLIKQERGW
jgi:hypothetical protein